MNEKKLGRANLLDNIEQMERGILIDNSLIAAEKVVGLFLLKVIRNRNHCTIGNERIAELLDSSERTVSRNINRLIKSGWFESKFDYHINGNGVTRTISINENYRRSGS